MKLSRFINIRIVFVLIFFSLFTYSRLFCTINYALSPEAHALLIVELEKDNDQKHIVDLLRNEKKYFDQIKEINITIKIEISRKLENLSEKVKIRVLEVQKNENFIFSSISKYTKNEISNAKDLFNMSISHYTEKELNLETLTQRKSKLTQSNSIDVLTPSIFTSDEQKQKFITNLKNANSYLTDLAALKIKLIDKKIQLAQIHVVLANIEKESAMRIFELKDKSQVVTKQDIKRTEIIVDEKQKNL
ncbi:hypothetical protein KAJ27_25830 [bacterium]|nr:hypothetical protein [bacterium]